VWNASVALRHQEADGHVDLASQSSEGALRGMVEVVPVRSGVPITRTSMPGSRQIHRGLLRLGEMGGELLGAALATEGLEHGDIEFVIGDARVPGVARKRQAPVRVRLHRVVTARERVRCLVHGGAERRRFIEG